MEKEIYKSFENTFHLYLPRICNHCINPACVASCPSGALYKRERKTASCWPDQDRCRGWRMCISGCPYKKVFFNWESSRPRSASAATPRRIRPAHGLLRNPASAASATTASSSDADKMLDAASTDNDQDLYKAHLDIFVDPFDPKIIEQAKKDGIPQSWIGRAEVAHLQDGVEWKIAFPLHPEFRTLPMVWYVPPLSPVQSQIDQKKLPTESGRRDSPGRGHASAGQVPGQPAHRRPRRVHRLGAQPDDRHALLPAFDPRRRQGGYAGSWSPPASPSSRPGHVSLSGHRQLRRPLRHPDFASGNASRITTGSRDRTASPSATIPSSGISMNSLFPERRRNHRARELAPFAAPKTTEEPIMQVFKLFVGAARLPHSEFLAELRQAVGEAGEPAIWSSDSTASRSSRRTSVWPSHASSTMRWRPIRPNQSRYVQTFDLTPEHSLHLTHHIFGEEKTAVRPSST